MLPQIYRKITKSTKLVRAELLTIFYVLKDPRSQWYVRLLSILIFIYCLSPIDFVFDFVPMFGIVDDFVVVSTFVYIIFKITPPDIIADSQFKARSQIQEFIKKILNLFPILKLFFKH